MSLLAPEWFYILLSWSETASEATVRPSLEATRLLFLLASRTTFSSDDVQFVDKAEQEVRVDCICPRVATHRGVEHPAQIALLVQQIVEL